MEWCDGGDRPKIDNFYFFSAMSRFLTFFQEKKKTFSIVKKTNITTKICNL